MALLSPIISNKETLDWSSNTGRKPPKGPLILQFHYAFTWNCKKINSNAEMKGFIFIKWNFWNILLLDYINSDKTVF